MYNQPKLVYNQTARAMTALYSNNLKHFLTPYFSFRLHITFKAAVKNEGQKKRHFYGNEHQCTLNQLRAGHVSCIKMDRLKGLTDLITLVEKTWKGKWVSATIYMRDEINGPFDKIVRKYYQGKIEEEQSPLLENQFFKIFFHGMDADNLPVFKDHPFVPDFKKEIEVNLLNATS